MIGEVGFVKSIRNSLIHLDGLPTIKINDLIENENGIRGWVSGLFRERVEALLLDEGQVQPGQMFHRSGKRLSIPVGNFLLGRAVNPLGLPIDGKGPLAKTSTNSSLELDKTAPGIGSREFITEQFDTGISVVDTLIPIAKGQRELIVGDARSGKTDFLIDVIVNQKNTDVICIYASIGKPIGDVRGIIDILRDNKGLAQTIIVAASSTDLSPLVFLSPQTAFTIAEYFQGQGKDVVVILDDMGTHAKIYREMALLSNRPPGRESYPGDIFYQHSHLLERAGKFNSKGGGGSITALPVIELNFSDFTTFIPTNLMGMTDGHLLFRSSLYNQGQRPAVDIPLSVSRVGQQTQERVQNLLSTRIKQILAQAAQLETVSRFSFELPQETQIILNQHNTIMELLKQPPLTYITKEVQTALLALPFTQFMLNKDKEFARKYQKVLLEALMKNPGFAKVVAEVFKFDSETDLLKSLDLASEQLITLTTEQPPKKISPKMKEENANLKPN